MIERTTRRQWLTDAGREYLQRCSEILMAMGEADAAVSETMLNPSGVLRVTSALSFAVIHVAPALPEFTARYPNLSVQLITANRYPDFIEAGIDVAIRTREQEADSGITVRRLATTRRVLAASPGYFKAFGKPTDPEALAGHRMLVYNLANDPNVLNMRRGNESRSISITSTLDSNDGQVLRAASLAGLGILIQPLYIIYDDIVAGRLLPILTDWQLPPLTINIAYQTRRHQPAKIRVFIDFMIERFAKLDLESKWAAPLG